MDPDRYCEWKREIYDERFCHLEPDPFTKREAVLSGILGEYTSDKYSVAGLVYGNCEHCKKIGPYGHTCIEDGGRITIFRTNDGMKLSPALIARLKHNSCSCTALCTRCDKETATANHWEAFDPQLDGFVDKALFKKIHLTERHLALQSLAESDYQSVPRTSVRWLTELADMMPIAMGPQVDPD